MMDEPGRPPDITPISRDFRARLAAYVGVIAAYLAAVKGDPLTPFQLAVFGAASSWSLVFEHRFRKPFFSSPVKIALIVAGSAIFILFITGHAAGATDQFANSIARFLFWNAIVFILSRNKSDYDLWTLAIIELSLFMISGAFVQPANFVPLLLLSTACLLYTFQRAAILRCGPAGHAQKGGLGLAFTTLLLALEVGALVFVAFPRGSFRNDKSDQALKDRRPKPPEGDPVASGERTGIPKNPQILDLTSYDKLKIDRRPVLTVRVTDRDDNPILSEQTQYLRGAVLDTYEKGRWKSSFRRLDRRDADDGASDGWTPLEAKPSADRKIVRQHIRTLPLAGDLAFCIPDPVRVQWPDARYDPAGVLFFRQAPRQQVAYVLESSLMPIDIPDFRAIPEPPSRYLQLPAGLEKLRETARERTQGVTGRFHTKARALQQYLMRNGFSYKLDPFVPSGDRDAVEHFLEKKEGYCAHYATALALMCRAVGVPARVATGFQLHDPDGDGTYLVRNSDAHAWVEVWFGPEYGWRSYDATPAEALAALNLPEGQAVPTTDPKKPGEADGPPKPWDHWIRDFDPASQNVALGEVLQGIGVALLAVVRFLASPILLGSLAALAALAALAYLLMPERQRRRIRQIAGGFQGQTSVEFYRDFLWALSRRGIRKAPFLTAREFARLVRERLKDDGVDFVTDRFYEAAYRGTPPSADDRRRIDEVIQRLLKPAAPAPAP